MNDLISVIVPVYNNERYVSRCIDSLMTQTYKNIEIIIIDDGSYDNTLEEVEKLAIKDRRIHIKKNSHRGVSYARNTGIKLSKGKYLTFVDSDDTVSPYYIEKMVILMQIDKSDIAICRIGDIYYPFSQRIVERNVTGTLSGVFSDDYYALLPFLYGPCLKLFKRDIIINHNILFPEDMAFAEDEYFNLNYYQYVQKYSFCDICLYFYHHRFTSSLSSIHTEDRFVKYLRKLSYESNILSILKIKNKQSIMLKNSLFIIKAFSFLGADDTYEKFCFRIKSVDEITHFLDGNKRKWSSQKLLLSLLDTKMSYFLGMLKYHIRRMIFHIYFMKLLYAFIKSR